MFKQKRAKLSATPKKTRQDKPFIQEVGQKIRNEKGLQ